MDNHSFYLKAKEIWKTVTKSDSEYTKELELQLEFHKKLLNLFQIGKYYYIVFNIYKADIEYTSDEVKNILGYEPHEFNIHHFLDKIHPDDKNYFLNFENCIAIFFKDLDFEKIKKYKAQYDVRIKTKNNNYVRILQQAIQIDYDENNYYRTLGIQTDITHIKKDGTPCLSIIGTDGEPSYYNIQNNNIFIKSDEIFTSREKNILKCIVEGRNSQEIAKLLFISLHTVHTHRKNILKKANCKTPIELVNKSMNEGWV